MGRKGCLWLGTTSSVVPFTSRTVLVAWKPGPRDTTRHFFPEKQTLGDLLWASAMVRCLVCTSPLPTPQAMVPVLSSCLRSWTARLLLSTLRGCWLAQVDVALEATRISLSWENLTHGKWNLQNQEVKVWPLLTKRFLPDSYKQWTFPESIFSVPQFAQNIS